MASIFLKEQKLIIVFLFFVFNSLFVANGCCQSSYKKEEAEPYKKLVSLYTKKVIMINAQLNEREWKYAKSINLHDDSHSSKDPRRTSNKVSVRTLWDKENLYIAFNVQDKNLQAKETLQDGSQLSRDDIVEFLIDTRNDKSSCWNVDDIIYHINLFGQKKDGRGTANCKSDPEWNGDAKIAVRLIGTLNDSTDIDTGYIVEVSISWKELKIKPFSGFQIGIDFANGDHGIFFDWSGAWPFRSPDAFGNLVLEEK